MNLKEVRTQFIKLSGRTDLVEDLEEYVDDGADYFIMAGMRELDRASMQHYHSLARKYVVLKQGDWIAQFARARALKKVFYGTGSSFKQLEYQYYDELRGRYQQSLLSTDVDTPLYWCPINLRHSPSPTRIESDTLDAISAYMDVASAQYNEYNGVIILPSPSQDITLELHGLFYSDELVLETDENYWTLNEPDILVMAALRELERSYRNITGANEWTTHINQKLSGLDMDLVEAQISSTDSMRG